MKTNPEQEQQPSATNMISLLDQCAARFLSAADER